MMTQVSFGIAVAIVGVIALRNRSWFVVNACILVDAILCLSLAYRFLGGM